MAGDVADKLLGVGDGFRRYFNDTKGRNDNLDRGDQQGRGDHLDRRESQSRAVPVSVVAEKLVSTADAPLPLTDEGILQLAKQRAESLTEVHGERFGFCVGVEAGWLSFGVRGADGGGELRHFVRCWAVVRGLGDEAWGSSGSLQLPSALIHGLDEAELPFVIPGRRRSGGMFSSLTAGLESRRSSAALATFHAVSSLMYSYLENHALRRRR